MRAEVEMMITPAEQNNLMIPAILATFAFSPLILGILGVFAELFLSFIIAEDALLRKSNHPIIWGVFTFFLSAITIPIYYLTVHKKTPEASPANLSEIRALMKSREIRWKIFFAILAILFALSVLIVIAAMFLMTLPQPGMKYF